MALPIGPYQGQDLTNYEAGNKFLPREFYSLGFPNTPPPSIANTPTGITNTQAAGSYMGYPSYEAWLLAQGGGGGGGGNGDPNPVAKYDPNQNLGPTNITDYEADAYGVGSTFQGSLAQLKDLYSKLPTPGNLIMKGIRHWKTRRAEKKAAADKIAASKAAVKASGADVGHYDPGAGGASHLTRGRDQGGLGLTQSQAQSVSQANKDAGYSSFSGLAEGGRIGYRKGEFVDADVNIEGPDYDVNEQMAGFIDPQDALNDMSMDIFGKPLNLLNEDEYQILIDMANDQAMGEQDRGIASLV